MRQAWPLVPLGEVLTQYQEYIDSPEPTIYPKLSVRLYGKGVVLDTPVDGSTLKMQRHQIAKAGQTILSEIWGKKGAIGLVPPEGEGALCTSHFFLFDVHQDKIEPKYLEVIFKANYLQDQLDAEARGTTGYAAVRPKFLLAAEIPLPSLLEQQRIIATVLAIESKLIEAKRLQQEAKDLCRMLCRSILFGKLDELVQNIPMRELLSLREPDVSVSPDEMYQFAGVYSFGGGMLSGPQKLGLEFAYKRLTRLSAGNFVYPKLMAWEGALAVVPAEYEGYVVSPEFPVFEINTDRVLPETLDIYFRTPSVWPLLSSVSTGTNVRRRRLHPSDFLALQIPLPTMKTQELLRAVTKRLDELSAIQTSAGIELDALWPAILDRAFKGKL